MSYGSIGSGIVGSGGTVPGGGWGGVTGSGSVTITPVSAQSRGGAQTFTTSGAFIIIAPFSAQSRGGARFVVAAMTFFAVSAGSRAGAMGAVTVGIPTPPVVVYPAYTEVVLEYNLILTDRFQENHGSFGDYSLDQVIWEINKPEIIKWTIPDSNPRCAAPILRHHEVQLRINGETRGIGPITQCDTDNGKHTFTAEGLGTYFRNLYIFEHGSLFFDDLTEQIDMAWALVQYGQQIPAWWGTGGAYPGFNSPNELRIIRGLAIPTGVKRARRYLWYDAKSIFTYLGEFDASALTNGFDFDFTMDDATGERKFNCYYPYKMADFSGYRYELGKNIVTYKVSEKTTDMGTTIIYKGGSAGTVHFFGQYTDQPAAVWYGDMQLVLSSQYLDTGWLNNQAQRQSRSRREPLIDPQLEVTVDDDILLTHREGDLINLIIKDNRHNIADIYRILKMTWNVGAGTVGLGVEKFSALYPLEKDFVITAPSYFGAP